jgi:serine/threonine protein kinase
MSGWTSKAGYRGQNKGPRSILYCAPEEFVDEEYPYAFDVYGVAVTWLRTILSEDKILTNETDTQQSSFGLGNEENLFEWRLAVRDFSHCLVSWEEFAVLHNTVPFGWDSLFGSSREGIHALRLLSSMMNYSPARRISASEALLGPYLNADCSAEAPPELPPAMPWSLSSNVQRWKKEREVQYGECRLED